MDHHLEEKVSLLLPFSWWSIHSVLQSGENPWSNSGHWALDGTTYIYISQPLTVLGFFHIRPLSKVHPNITCKAASSTAVCLILSKFDYCNGLLSGLPQKQIKHLQAVQNAAARTVMKCKKQKNKKLITALQFLDSFTGFSSRNGSATKLSLLLTGQFMITTPLYLSDLLHKHTPSCLLRSASRPLLDVPWPRDSKTKPVSFHVCHTLPQECPPWEHQGGLHSVFQTFF